MAASFLEPMVWVNAVYGGGGGRTVYSLLGAKTERSRSPIVTSSFVGFS